MRASFISIIISASVAACGYTDGGSGTGTLKVVAGDPLLGQGDNGIEYNPDGNEFRADMEITRASDGTAVTDAAVTLRDDESGQTFTLQADGNGGHYRLRDATGYHRRIVLTITTPNDGRLEAKLEGPGPHTITTPAANEPLTLAGIGQNLGVSWKAPDGVRADYAYIRVHMENQNRDAFTTPAEDTGDFDSVPAVNLNTGNCTVSVQRFNQVTLTGGAPGSLLELRYNVRNEFVIN